MGELLINAVVEGRYREIPAIVQAELDEGTDPKLVLEKLLSGMRIVAAPLSGVDADIPEVLISAKCVRLGVELLQPLISAERMYDLGTVIIGTVSGDLHDIGKNLVSMMFEGEGFRVIDLGVDVQRKQFVETLKAHPEVEIVCVSCLLTTCMVEMRETVAALRRVRRKKPLYVMVGGAPVTRAFAEEIGADMFTDNAWDAAQCAKRIASEGRTAQ